jgi:hypothetical protein
MEPGFWRARWSEGRIGFHEGTSNAHLRKNVDVLAGARRVLVPLCGKAEDLAVLAAAGIVLGEQYPRPVVDHATARDAALRALSAIKAPAS